MAAQPQEQDWVVTLGRVFYFGYLGFLGLGEVSMSWYATSMGFIKKQKMENPHMSRQKLRRHCSKNYPFRERSGYAYKAFLEAMRDEFGRTRKDPAPEKAGQTDFIGY